MATLISLDQAVSRMQERQHRLADVKPFFRLHARKWKKLAVAYVGTVGRTLKPDEVSTESWERYLAGLQDLVRLWFVSPDEDGEGVDIDLRIRARGQSLKKAPITMDDIRAWVNAGAKGDPLGKHLDDRDDASLDLERHVQNVFHALRHGSMSGESIREFLEQNTSTGPDGRNLLDALVKIWSTHLSPVIRRDWQTWVREQVALK